MTEPMLKETTRGWLALGTGWAVEATSREEALKRFREAEERHREIDARPLPEHVSARRGA
jgi:hypothetical protein